MAKVPDGFTEKSTKLLVRLYDGQPVSVDNLPYTDELDQMQAEFCSRSRMPITHRKLYRKLMELRKASMLRPKRRRNKTNRFNAALEGAPN